MSIRTQATTLVDEALSACGRITLRSSSTAAERVARLRARIAVESRVVLASSMVSRFDLVDGRVEPELSDGARRGFTRFACVSPPFDAARETAIEDESSHVGVRFALEGARGMPTADGIATYAGAFYALHRVTAGGRRTRRETER